MAIADIAVVMDIFPAREEPIPGVTGATISDLIDAAGRSGRLRTALRRRARAHRRARPPGDLVITMGIGNVYLLCDEIRDTCARRAGESTSGAT